MAYRIKTIEDMKDEELLSYCESEKTRLESANKDKHDKMKECYDYYRQSKDYLKKKFKDREGMPQYVSARPFQQVEVLKSFMLGNRPTIYAEFEKDYQKEATEGLDFVNTVLYGKGEINFEEKLDDFEAWREIGGTGVAKVLWDREDKMVNTEEPMTMFGMEIGMTRTVKKRVPVKNTPDVKILVPMRFFPEVDERDVTKMASCCEEIPMNYSHIKTLGNSNGLDGQPIFKGVSKIDDKMVQEWGENGTIEDWKDTADAGNQTERDASTHDPKVKVEQWWFSPNWSVTVIPGSMVLQKKQHELGRPPYVRSVFINDANLFWGIGALEMLLSAFDQKDEYRNLRIAKALRLFGGLMVYNPLQLIDAKKDMTPKAAWQIRCKGDPSRAVYFPPVSGAAPELINEERMIDEEINLEGVSPLLAPSSKGDAPDTASGTNMMQSAAAGKFKRPRGRLEHAVEEIVELICKYCSIHLVDGREFYIPDKKGHLSRKYVNYRWFENPVGGAIFRMRVEEGSTRPINEGEEVKKWAMIKQMYQGDGRVDQNKLDEIFMAKMGVKDIQGLFHPEPMLAVQKAQGLIKQAFEAGKEDEISEEVRAALYDDEVDIKVLEQRLKDAISDVQKVEKELSEDSEGKKMTQDINRIKQDIRRIQNGSRQAGSPAPSR